MPCRDDGDFRILFMPSKRRFSPFTAPFFPVLIALKTHKKREFYFPPLKELTFYSRSLKSPVFYPWKVNGGAADFNEERRPFPILRLRRFAGLFYKSRVYFSQSLES